jgi:hypothetical protein
LARIDALVLASPTVTLDFTYYPTDGFNEKVLGFYVQNTVAGNTVTGNFASGQMGSSNGQNYYIITADEGSDLNTLTGNKPLEGKTAIAIGNAFLSNYTFDASVGNLPTVSVTVEGLNIKSSTITGVSGAGASQVTGNFVNSPTIVPISGTEVGSSGRLMNPEENVGTDVISALRPGDITLTWDEYYGKTGSPISSLSGANSINIQSASLQLPLSRTPIERLGSRFAFARVVDFPIVATLNVSAIVNEIESRSLANMLDDNQKRNITLTIKKPGGSSTAMQFTLKGTQLQSESFSSSIGANKTVDLVFQTQIGGPTDTNNGIYLSGTYQTGVGGYPAGNWGY